MTQGVASTIQLRVLATLSETPQLGQADQVVNEYQALALAAGVGAGNSDTLLTAALDIAESGSIVLDLNGTGNTDEFGNDIAMADVQVIAIFANADNTTDIVLGDNASAQFNGPLSGNGTISIEPGGMFLSAGPKGVATTPSTAHLLKISNGGSGAAALGSLVVIGRSA